MKTERAVGSPAETPTADRVWTVAAQLFREKGYHAATTRELADRLQITRATLYYHVTKKEDLLHRICVESLRRVSTAVVEALAGVDDPTQRIRVLVKTHLVSMLTDIDMHATMLFELRQLSGDQLKEVVKLRDAYESVVRGVVTGAQRAGSLRSDIDNKAATLALLNLLNWTMSWYRPGGPLSPVRFADVAAEIYLEGMTQRP